LALFIVHKIAFYRFNQGGSYYCRGAQIGAGSWDHPARTDGVGLLGDANQQGGDRWMLVAHVSGPGRLQPELYAQTAWGGVVVLARKPGVGRFVTVNVCSIWLP